MVATDYASGKRVVFGETGAPEAGLAEAVAASCAGMATGRLSRSRRSMTCRPESVRRGKTFSTGLPFAAPAADHASRVPVDGEWFLTAPRRDWRDSLDSSNSTVGTQVLRVARGPGGQGPKPRGAFVPKCVYACPTDYR